MPGFSSAPALRSGHSPLPARPGRVTLVQGQTTVPLGKQDAIHTPGKAGFRYARLSPCPRGLSSTHGRDPRPVSDPRRTLESGTAVPSVPTRSRAAARLLPRSAEVLANAVKEPLFTALPVAHTEPVVKGIPTTKSRAAARLFSRAHSTSDACARPLGPALLMHHTEDVKTDVPPLHTEKPGGGARLFSCPAQRPSEPPRRPGQRSTRSMAHRT